MIREEQIKMASVENADKVLAERDNLDFAINALADFDNGLTMGFTAGARWADKTMIDKACEWLDDNFMNLIWGKTRSVYAGGNFATVDEMIACFRKAMEEQVWM